jgi:Bacterial Ig-like domain (group 2)
VKTLSDTLRGSCIALLIAGLSACGGHHAASGGSDTNSPPPPPPATVAKVVVTPTAVLVQPGGTVQLSAQALDASGATVSGAAITWSASSSVVAVDANGKVTGGNSVDSATITASVGTVASVPVSALVATVTSGTQIISNDQVLSDPALVDTTQAPGVGSQFKTTLAGSNAPAVGSIIVGSGDKPISGRVVSSAPNGANTDVVFEVVALDEVFSQLKFDQTYNFNQLTPQFDVQPSGQTANTDGTTTYQFALDTPDPAAASVHRQSRAKAGRTKGAHPALELGSFKWKIGPFSCSADADLSPAVSFRNVGTNITPNFGPVKASINLTGTGLQADISTSGTLGLALDGEMHLSEKLTGKLSCDAELFKYIVPVPPVVAVVFVPVVPVLGVRASASGTLKDGDVVIGLKSSVIEPMTIGMSLSPSGVFTNVSTLGDSPTTDFKWTLNPEGPSTNLQFQGDAKAGVYANVAFTNGFLVAYTIYDGSFNPIRTLIDGFAGLHATVGLAGVNPQIQDETLQTGYKLTVLAELQAGSDVSTFVGFLSKILKISSITLPDLKFEPSLFSSPQGQARTSLRRFSVGDTVQFTVNLDADSVDPPIVGYNVKQVEIWRKKPGGTSEMIGMDAGAPGTAGAAGKKDFTILWKADVTDVTANSDVQTAPANYYAVVVPNFGEEFEFKVGPALGWLGVRQLGGPNNQEGHRVATDSAGNVIIAAISGDPLVSENRSAVGGASEVQIFKMTPYGGIIWARNIDGAGDENVTGITIDARDNIFIAGRAVDSSLNGLPTAGGFSGWAASYSADGTQRWLQQWQDAYYSTAEFIALGPNRELYVLGSTSTAAGYVGGTAFSYECTDIESATNDCGDLTLRRLDPDSGALLWSQTDVRYGLQIARGLTVDAAGNIYTSATTGVDTVTQANGYQGQDGEEDFEANWLDIASGYVAHWGVAFQMWNSDGSVGWRKSFKNPSQATATGKVYSDEFSGGIVATSAGLFAIMNTTGQFGDTPNLGGQDSALFSLDAGSGEATYLLPFASEGTDSALLYGPTRSSGGMLVAGLTTGYMFAPNAGGYDAFVASLSPAGSLIWARQFGGPGNDQGVGATAAPDGSVYLTGFTDGLMPATLSGLPFGISLNLQGGGEDFFVAKLSASLGLIQSLHPSVNMHH